MSSINLGGAAHPDGSARHNALYFLAWRWHFYASLYVIPFLVMLATTGLIMLWISALSGLNGERGLVSAGTQPMAVSALQAKAEAAVEGGKATQYLEPLGPDHVAVFKITAGDAATGVTVDPYTGEVIESFAWDTGWYVLASEIHGSLLIGDTGDRMIEIAASLGVLLVVSGLYLHWPRAGWRAALVPNLTAKGRAFWKSLHGVTGFWISAIMLVFLISGLSWAGIWGEKMVQAWSTFPAEKFESPLSDKTHADMNHGAEKEVPWALEQTPLPASGSLKGKAAVTGAVTIDSVTDFARGLGFNGRFQVSLASGPEGVWTVSHDSMSNDGPDPWGDRTIHIDQYTGNVLADVRYSDYSAYAKMMAVGIAFHEGDMGLWNLVLNTGFCLASIFLPVSGFVMWWKRRPQGAARLGAPPVAKGPAYKKARIVVIIALGIAFPMAGLAMIAVGLIDLLVIRHIPRLKDALS
jgi:uncharacterized iron-regulated membrane protein